MFSFRKLILEVAKSTVNRSPNEKHLTKSGIENIYRIKTFCLCLAASVFDVQVHSIVFARIKKVKKPFEGFAISVSVLHFLFFCPCAYNKSLKKGFG